MTSQKHCYQITFYLGWFFSAAKICSHLKKEKKRKRFKRFGGNVSDINPIFKPHFNSIFILSRLMSADMWSDKKLESQSQSQSAGADPHSGYCTNVVTRHRLLTTLCFCRFYSIFCQ